MHDRANDDDLLLQKEELSVRRLSRSAEYGLTT